MTRLVATLGVAGISFSAIFVALASVPPSTAAFFRMAYALPFLFVLAIPGGLLKGMNRKAMVYSLGAGVIFALNITTWHYNIEILGTGLSTVMGNAQVIFIGVLAWLLYGERPTRLALALIPIMFLGIILISGIGSGGTAVAQPALGAGLGTLTALLNAAYFLLLREATRRSPKHTAVLLLVTTGALVTSFITALIDGGFEVAVPAPSHMWLFALAVVSQVLGWRFISPALSSLPALEVAVLMLLQPTLTILWGYLIFGEIHSLLQWLGVAVLLAGIALLNMHGSTRPARTPGVPKGKPGRAGEA